jgi:hypothetical protein
VVREETAAFSARDQIPKIDEVPSSRTARTLADKITAIESRRAELAAELAKEREAMSLKAAEDVRQFGLLLREHAIKRPCRAF